VPFVGDETLEMQISERRVIDIVKLEITRRLSSRTQPATLTVAPILGLSIKTLP
jgi:hypothetical protein